MWSEITTNSVEPVKRIDFWTREIRGILPGVEFSITSTLPFEAQSRQRRLNDLAVSVSQGTAHCSRRRRVVGGSPEERLFTVNLSLQGSTCIIQNGLKADLRQGDFALLDVAQPYEIHHDNGFAMLTIVMPHRRLIQRLPRPELSVAQAVDSKMGSGALASSLLRAVPRAVSAPAAAGIDTVERMIVEVVCEVFGPADPGQLRTAALTVLAKAKRYIEENLHDSRLDRHSVAAHAGVSVRRLNAILATKGLSISRYVQERRNARARALMRNPAWKGFTLLEIALECGFADGAHFSRSFKGLTGMTPTEYRRVAQKQIVCISEGHSFRSREAT